MPKGNPSWVKGVSGNPNGRGKGQQDKYTKIRQAFFMVFDELGKEGLLEFAKRDPSGYYRVVASLLPKEIEADVSGELKVTWEK